MNRFKPLAYAAAGLLIGLVNLSYSQVVSGKRQAIPDGNRQLILTEPAELFMPGLVSTKNADVKITFSPDGKHMLWGGIDWLEDRKDMDIWQSVEVNGQWTKPERVTFDTDSNDFDPFFSPDGSGVYFFSNRSGGFGGDDIYFASYNKESDRFAEPVNLGPEINTSENEWAPVTNAKGNKFIFSSNGHGGYGGQDLFVCSISQTNTRDSSGQSAISVFGKPLFFSKAVNLGPSINSADNDFDAVVLPDETIVFTAEKMKTSTDKKADLYISYYNSAGYSPAVKLPEQINSPEFWTFGPSVNLTEPNYLYFSSHQAKSMGRTDIYRIKFKMIDNLRYRK
ncbi:TolB family protein [Pedobacter lusitanus]|nr:PD40 domain-containing protein [Pedobacter lusitanus]